MHPALMKKSDARCTLIESFSGEISVIRPGFKKKFGEDLQEAKQFIDNQGWDVSIFILMGSLVLRKMILHDHDSQWLIDRRQRISTPPGIEGI